MQELTYFEYFLAQLCLIFAAGCIIFRAMLMSSRRRVARLQQAFDEKIAKVNAELEQRKQALLLNLTEEIEQSEKRYALGSDSVPLQELDIQTYQFSLAIPMRLAYLRVEKNAVEKRDTEEYWGFVDQALEDVLVMIGKAYGLGESSVRSRTDQSIPLGSSSNGSEGASFAAAKYATKEFVDQLKDEIETLRAQEEELLVFKEKYEALRETVDALEENKPAVLPKINDLIKDEEELDALKGLLGELGDYFKDMDYYFPGRVGAIEDGSLGEEAIGESQEEGHVQVDTGAQQIEILNNIIHQQGVEINELKSSLNNKGLNDDLNHKDSVQNLRRNLEESEAAKEHLERELDQLSKAYEDLMGVQEGGAIVPSRGSGDDDFSMEKIGDPEAVSGGVLALEQEGGVETAFSDEGVDSELVSQSAQAAKVLIGDEPLREIVMLQQEMLNVERVNVLMEQRFIVLYEHYLELNRRHA